MDERTALARPDALPARVNGAQSIAPNIRVNTENVGLFDLCNALARSGYFKDARDASQAVVKVLFGQELGIGPVAAMSGIHVIEGKPALSATLLGGLIKRSARYDYRVAQHTEKVCELIALERGEEMGRATWTLEDAVRAKLADKDNWKKYPRQMLFGRAMTELARTYMPDLLGGAPAYTAEELGAETDASGEPSPGWKAQNTPQPLAASASAPVTEGAPSPAPTAPLGLQEHRKRCDVSLKSLGVDPKAALPFFGRILGRPVEKFGSLTVEDWRNLDASLSAGVDAKRRVFALWKDLSDVLHLEPTGDKDADRQIRLGIWATLLRRETLASSSELIPAEMRDLGDAIEARIAEERKAQAEAAAGNDEPLQPEVVDENDPFAD